MARAMENRLRANDHKGGWMDEDSASLLLRLDEEADELSDATVAVLMDEAPPSLVLKEAADVCNFAMMVADVSGALATPQAGGEVV